MTNTNPGAERRTPGGTPEALPTPGQAEGTQATTAADLESRYGESAGYATEGPAPGPTGETSVLPTPGAAEGDRATVDADLGDNGA